VAITKETKHMKRIMFNLLPAIFLWLLSCCIATAQDPAPLLASSAQITFQNQQAVTVASASGVFDQVTVNPQDAMTVQLQFPITAGGTATVIQVMDGGVLGIDGSSVIIGQDGTLSFPFQVSDVPGLYRVLVISNDQIIAQVQFWIPNPPEG
jgi:hypothetical protein